MRNLEILARNWFFHIIWKISAIPVSFAKIPVGGRALTCFGLRKFDRSHFGSRREGERCARPTQAQGRASLLPETGRRGCFGSCAWVLAVFPARLGARRGCGAGFQLESGPGAAAGLMDVRGRDGGTGPRKRGAGRSISPAGPEVQARGKRGESPSASSGTGKRSRSSASYASSNDSFNTAGSVGQPQLHGGGSLPPPPPPAVANVGYVRPPWLPGVGPQGPDVPLPPPPFVPLQRKRDQPKENTKDIKEKKDKSDDQDKAVYAYDPAPGELDSELDVGSDYSRRTPSAPPPKMSDVTGEVLRKHEAEGLSQQSIQATKTHQIQGCT